MPSKTVLYLNASTRSNAERSKLSGVCRFARMCGWKMYIAEKVGRRLPIAAALRKFSPAGAIVDSFDDGGFLPSTRLGGIPVVFLDGDPSTCDPDASVVVHEPASVAEAAIREFVSIGAKSVAYAGWFDRIYWSEWRSEAFRAVAGKAGLPCAVFASRRGDRHQLEYEGELRLWIESLPEGTGILAANDCIASRVLSACRGLGISVPEEMSLLGVDNDVARCEAESPTISSIAIDFEMAGYRAGEMLASLMRGDAKPAGRATFGIIGTVRRESTRSYPRLTPKIKAAVDLIREKACEGLTARDVAIEMGGSRRLAEMRFRSATGKSILSEIQSVRMEKAKYLLAHTRKPIGVIAAMCGYRTEAALRKLFSLETGVSMRAWRNGARPGDCANGTDLFSQK